MVRMTDLHENEQRHLMALPCPSFETAPWVTGPPLAGRRVALISTAGLQRRDDRPFVRGDADYRVFHRDTPPSEIVMRCSWSLERLSLSYATIVLRALGQ